MVMVVMFVFLRFRFHSGGLGVGGVFARRCLCLHNRPHVRNRPREDHMTVPMVTFGGKRRVASFRVAGAGVAFCDIPTCLFMTCRKPFCVAGAILLQGYQKMACIFPGQRSTLNVSIFILRGRRSTSDVSCCVFFANRIVRAASSGDNMQTAWQAYKTS